MNFKRWLQRIMATIVLRLGSLVTEWVGEDVFMEAVQKEVQKHSQSENLSFSVSGGLGYEQLKRVEDEWVAAGLIR